MVTAKEAMRVNWDMQNPYAKTAYERDYWGENAPEAEYVKRQMGDIASQYRAKGAGLQGQMQQKGLGMGGTIGQFAYGQQVSNPWASAENALRNEQFARRWSGEQAQLGRQADYTNLLNQLSLQKALAKQKAGMDIRSQRKSEQAQANRGMMGMISDIGSSLISSFGGGGGGGGE